VYEGLAFLFLKSSGHDSEDQRSSDGRASRHNGDSGRALDRGLSTAGRGSARSTRSRGGNTARGWERRGSARDKTRGDNGAGGRVGGTDGKRAVRAIGHGVQTRDEVPAAVGRMA